MFDMLHSMIVQDVGIDLGTANTVVFVEGKGITRQEPSVVAKHEITGDIIAIGKEAKKMLGKAPKNISVIRPLRDGVIADFDAAEAMLQYYIQQVSSRHPFSFLVKPRVIIGIPSGVTDVERRAVQSAAISAGAGQAFLIEEPMAAAIGAGLKVEEPEGRLVVDIGGGTTEIAVISLGGIVLNRSLRIAGDELDEAVMSHIRTKHNVLIGEATAEQKSDGVRAEKEILSGVLSKGAEGAIAKESEKASAIAITKIPLTTTSLECVPEFNPTISPKVVIIPEVKPNPSPFLIDIFIYKFNNYSLKIYLI